MRGEEMLFVGTKSVYVLLYPFPGSIFFSFDNCMIDFFLSLSLRRQYHNFISKDVIAS